jgi:hypothetical protein
MYLHVSQWWWLTVIPTYLIYFVKQALEACYFVVPSEDSQPTLIWRPIHHFEATASANNAIKFPAAAEAGGGCGGDDHDDDYYDKKK